MQAALGAIFQLLILALVIERAFQVLSKLRGAPDPNPDVDGLSKTETFVAMPIAFLILLSIPYDLLEKIFGLKPLFGSPFVGIIIASVLVAGGSDGLRRIADAISASAKASKAESLRRTAFARN